MATPGLFQLVIVMTLTKQTVTEMSLLYILKGCPLHVVTCRP